MCTDMGVESGITYVPPVDVTKVFPWWKEKPLICEEDGLQTLCITSGIHLKNAIPTPGVEHTCHNALKQIVEKLTHYKEWYRKAVAVGRCFSSTYYTDRLKRVCLSSPEALPLVALLDAFDVKPDEGRFANLLEFLDQLLPLRRGMERFYNDALFRGSDVEKATDGDFVDLNLVTQFVLDPEQWQYGNMLLSLGAGWLEVQYFSRGCSCHRAKDVDADNCHSYYKRKAAMQKETGLAFDCPAKGLHADEFACGKGKEILTEAYKAYGRLLISELCDVSPGARHRIMADWDTGVDQSMYVATLKFAVHQQLPVVLCGMCHRDPEKAAGAALRALTEWAETSDSSAHCDRVRDVFMDEALVREIEAFANDKNPTGKPLLSDLLDELDLVRFNEISVESLHRVGSVVAKKATHHGPAHVANALRGKTIATRGGGRWSWAEYAEACRSTRSVNQVVAMFGFRTHPLMAEERDKFSSRTSRRRRDGFLRDTALMSMFYRTDAPTMFNDNQDAKATIKENSEAVLQALKDSLQRPLGEAMSEGAPASVKAEAITVNYALRHFKDQLFTCSVVSCFFCVRVMVGASLAQKKKRYQTKKK